MMRFERTFRLWKAHPQAPGSRPISHSYGPKSKNIVWAAGNVSQNERSQLQKGAAVWLTGLSGSGKSAIASRLEEKLHERGVLSYRLDGDNIRFGLSKDLGFSAEDRNENIRRVGEVRYFH